MKLKGLLGFLISSNIKSISIKNKLSNKIKRDLPKCYDKNEKSMDTSIELFHKENNDIPNNSHYNFPMLPGIETGIPLLIFQNIFTNLHYGYDITTLQNVLFQLAVGYFTYGTDRVLDAYDETSDRFYFKENKLKMYEAIKRDKDYIIITLASCYTYVIYTLSNYKETIPFIFALVSTFEYKKFKTAFGILKPVYITILWTMASIIIPCVIHDNDYSIFTDYQCYLPAMLTLFSTSNFADTLDINEDKSNNINTLPIVLSERNSNILNIALLFLSSIIFYNNPHYLDRPNISNLYELQNLGVALSIIYSKKTI